MQKSGLLSSDLPGGGRLLDETRAAMQSGDWMRAKYAADQLLEEVNSVHVDRAFIGGKFARLNAALAGKPLEGEARKQLQLEATTAYGDGRFAVANQKINRLFSLLK
jgi:hypothetical protein